MKLFFPMLFTAIILMILSPPATGAEKTLVFNKGEPANGYNPKENLPPASGAGNSYSSVNRFYLYIESGGYIVGEFAIGNLGATDRLPTITLTYIDKQNQVLTEKVRPDIAKSSASETAFRFGDNYFIDAKGSFSIKVVTERLGLTLDIKPQVGPFRPGDGVISTIADGRGVRWTILTPRAEAVGELTVDGQKRSIKGPAFLENITGNLPGFDFAHRLRSVWIPSEKYSTILRAIEPLRKFGEPLIVSATAIDDNGVFFSSGSCMVFGGAPPYEQKIGDLGLSWKFTCSSGKKLLKGEVRQDKVVSRYGYYDNFAPLDQALKNTPIGFILYGKLFTEFISPEKADDFTINGFSNVIYFAEQTPLKPRTGR